MGHSYDGIENRKHSRHPKNYSLFFYFEGTPDKRSDGTLVKDIGKGGVRFTTSQAIKTGTQLIFEIGIPYIAPKKLTLRGQVISSKENIPGLVYEIRAQFNSLDEQTTQLLDMIEKKKPKGS